MDENTLNQKYLKASQIIGKLLKLDEKTQQKIYGYFNIFGVIHFFNNLESLDFSSEVIEKLKALNFMVGGESK